LLLPSCSRAELAAPKQLPDVSASIGRWQSNASNDGTIALIGMKEIVCGIVLNPEQQRRMLPVGANDQNHNPDDDAG
jgi:hypothetical protein